MGVALVGLGSFGQAQIPDLLNTLDAGGRSMGMGGSLGVAGADTLSSYLNPAGLAYLDGRRVGITYRNLPSSSTTISGQLDDPNLSTRGERGSNNIAHVGFAVPMSDVLRGVSGTLGIAYTVGGFIDDTTTGTVAIGGFTGRNYVETTEAKSEYFTISYGRANASQSFAWGVGLVVLSQGVSYRQRYDLFDGSTSLGTQDTGQLDSRGTGLGVLVGAQYIPPGNPNLSLGASYRSEINLSGNSETAAYLDKIPARLMLGAAYRRDALRGGEDFAVLGAQLAHYFKASNGSVFDRKEQTTFGIGLEYNYRLGPGWLPVRVGYQAIPGGGTGYGSRNTFNYGIGYRPENSPYTIDLNWGSPQGSGADFSIAVSYKFGF
jgi:hypothetical protein